MSHVHRVGAKLDSHLRLPLSWCTMGVGGNDLIPSSHCAQLLEWVGWFTTLDHVVDTLSQW